MNEQRKQILEMLAEGKINADEAERLIAALERSVDESPVDGEPRRKPPKYLRVKVDDRSEGEQTRVNVRIPFQLLRAGVRLASLIPPSALNQANDQLARSGVPIDLTQLKPEQLEELIEHLADMTIEVEEANANVHVFCE